MNQTTIFDFIYPKYKITKPIRLIETFSGYGSQALALKYLGIEFEHWKTCEWAIKSIQAYKDIHFTDEKEIDIDSTKEQLVECLFKYGISANYNEPMTKEQISRLSESQLKTIWNNILITYNLVNIQQVKGEDLEIIDTDKYDYIMCYSFPCQDLSLAGKGKGMSDTSTRSGMLWEVERILTECKELGTLPQILLMENVPQVHGEGNVEDFNKWQLRLEELGYKNYWEDLIATDYGIPQTRNRCFMVSILGDYSYSFPQKIPLKLKLKDLLEDNVDEKYYLSDAMMNYITSEDDKYKVNPNNLIINRDIACTKSTREGNTRADSSDYISEDVESNYKLKIKNATKQGYLEATDGDGINLSNRMEHQRGNVQKDKIQTLTTSGGNDRGVVISNNLKKDLCNKLIKENKVKENDVIRHSYSNSRLNNWEERKPKTNNISPTLDTRCDCLGVCVGTYQYSKSDKFMNGKDRLQLGKDVSDTLQTTPKEGVCYNDLRIRKLSPRECGRLMNVKDEDINKLLKNQSNSSAYHLFGDSICTNVLMAIFGELLDVNWIEKFKEIENKFIDK